MKILYVTFGDLLVGAGSIRSVSMLRAVADAGHQVDVIAATAGLKPHPNIHYLTGNEDKRCSKRRIRLAIIRAMGSKAYDAVHAVDDAVLYVSRLGALKRIRVIYEASRCFSGSNGSAPSLRWKLFPTHYQHVEKKILKRAAIVFSSCDNLTADLTRLAQGTSIAQVEDIPAHPLFALRESDRGSVARAFPQGASLMAVVSVMPGNEDDVRTLLLAARKVIEKEPRAGIFFKGLKRDQAEKLAGNLDISERCRFLENDEMELFLAALSVADTALFVPQPGSRYRHPEILTLMHSSALVVCVHDGAYASLLNDRNSLQVDYTAASISAGLLRVVHEPLLTFGMVMQAQQLVADRYTFSSFKHQVRMAYHNLAHMH